jgi:outer membrane protein
MRTFLKVTACFVLLIASTSLQAQPKLRFGHINSQELLAAMPERDSAQLVLERYVKQLQNQLQSMQDEYQTKVQDYLKNQATYSDLIKQTKEQELNTMNENIQAFQTNAQQDMQQRESQLIQPIIDKADKAVKEVGKENGFTYIFDLSRGSVIYYSEISEDVTPLVKKKLGIK